MTPITDAHLQIGWLVESVVNGDYPEMLQIYHLCGSAAAGRVVLGLRIAREQ